MSEFMSGFINILVCSVPGVITGLFPFRERLKLSLTRSVILAYLLLLPMLGTAALLKYLGLSMDIRRLVTLALAVPPYFGYIRMVGGDGYKKLFCYCAAVSLGLLLYGASEFLKTALALERLGVYGGAAAQYLLCILLGAGAVYEILKIYGRYLIPSLDDVNEPMWSYASMLAGVLTLFSCMTFFVDRVFANVSLRAVFMVFIVAGVVAAYYFLLKSLAMASKQQSLLAQLLTQREQMQMQTAQYHRMTERIEQTRKARHDLRHHMAALSTLAADNNLEAIQKYLKEYLNTQSGDMDAQLCRNYAVDIIVRHYASIARGEGIDVSIRLPLPLQMPVEDIDLCIVFGNCMENAIEACKNVTPAQRFLRLSALVSGQSLAITQENSFDGLTRAEGSGRFRSQKEGGGIGLDNISAVAAKYHGEAAFTTEGNLFRSFVVLTLPEQAPIQEGVARPVRASLEQSTIPMVLK